MPQTAVDIALAKLLPKIQDKLLEQVPPEMSGAVSGLMQIAKWAADQAAKRRGAADGDEPLRIACSQLSTLLGEMQTNAVQAIADFQTAILKDWGRLRGSGQAIAGGIWYWSTDFDVKSLKEIAGSTRLNFYQTLLPVKWKIMRIQTILYASLPFLSAAPQYSFMYQTNGAVWWWWVCANQSAPARPDTEGPFPNQTLMRAFMSLAQRKEDVFSGTNGWRLPVDTMYGYTEPSGALRWQPYQDKAEVLRGRLLEGEAIVE
jgi:hypothetical protein